MPTPNSVPQRKEDLAETAAMAAELAGDVERVVLNTLEALLKQYGADAAILYLTYLQSLAAETASVQDDKPDVNYPEELAA